MLSIRGYLELIRIPNSVLSGLGAVFSLLVYTYYHVENTVLIPVAFLTGFLVTGASMIINDVVDLEVDRLNKPWKPLPRGDASPGTSMKIAWLFLVVAVVLNAVVNLFTTITTIFYGFIGASYSYLRRKWWSHILVALSTTGPIVYGYVAAGLPVNDLYFTILFTIVIFTVTLGREFLKAIQDIEGDSKQGYKTIATVHGLEKASKTMLATGLTGGVLGLATLATNTSIFYKVFITIAAVVYIYSVIQAYRNKNTREKLEKPRKNTLLAMYIGTIAFWLSKIQF